MLRVFSSGFQSMCAYYVYVFHGIFTLLKKNSIYMYICCSNTAISLTLQTTTSNQHTFFSTLLCSFFSIRSRFVQQRGQCFTLRFAVHFHTHIPANQVEFIEKNCPQCALFICLCVILNVSVFENTAYCMFQTLGTHIPYEIYMNF